MGDNLNGGTTENKVKRTAAQTAVLMAILTLVSKLLGFVREMVIAGFFGTSYIVDAYVMAQTIPGMLFGGIFSSIGTAYLPTYSKINEEKGEEAGNRFTSQILNIATIFAIIALVIGMLFSDQLVSFIARDFPQKTAELTSFYLKVTFGYTIFTCSINMLDKYLQYKGSFLKPIVAGYFQNFGIIAGAVIAAFTSHYYLAFGFLFGYALRFIMILVGTFRKGFKYSLDLNFGEPAQQIMILSVPVFIGSSISQLNGFIDKSLASSLQEGSVAALNYGMLLVSLITGLTSTIIATIMYPKITKAMNEGNWEYFNSAVEKALIVVLLISVPFGMGAMAFADEVVQVVYERGAFDATATALTGGAFFYYALGLPFQAINAILTHVYYSMRDMKTPIKCAAAGVIVNISLNLALIGSMQHKGLALATSMAAIVNVLLLGVMLMKKYAHVKVLKEKSKVVKIVIAAGLSVLVAVVFYNIISVAIWMPRMVYLGLAVAGAGVIYVMFLFLARIDELEIFLELIKRKHI